MTPPKNPSLIRLLKPYQGWIIGLLVLTVFSNGLNLWLPQIIARGIDAYLAGSLNMPLILWEFAIATVLILLLVVGQGIIQSYASEKVARDLRQQLAEKLSRQSYAYIQKVSPAKLMTNMTADIDAIKMFVAMAIVAMVSSVMIIIGSAVLLLVTNWQLALAVLVIVPLIFGTFFTIFRKVGVLFKKTREVMDWLNKVINESILGAALIRVLHGEKQEREKFLDANKEAKDVGMKILAMFAAMIPMITFIANLATIILVTFGGWLVINGGMTIGQLSAFASYVMLLIFPIISLGFMSNFIAQAGTSYGRINEVLEAPEQEDNGTLKATLRGDVEVRDVQLMYGEKHALKDVSFTVKAGSRTAIIGPTAAGKTQLVQLLSGLTEPTSGTILYDDHAIAEYDKNCLHEQIGFVFQDSVIFNMSLRENIAFKSDVSEEQTKKAIETAELQDFIESLPEKLETVVSERGSSLSGGQKQRIMLARALSLNPQILLLDDFTARVDNQTEQRILKNLASKYPKLTLINITQKIASVIDYDQIILLMEGEMIARGTHEELMETCPEYVQIYTSQRSTNNYEVRS